MITEVLGYTPAIGEELGSTGILYQPSMDIHDPSKLQAFMSSPRAYFFSHILGWQQESQNIHLVFGSAWHEAMESLHLSLNGADPYGVGAISTAYDLFMAKFEEAYPHWESTTDIHPAKNPSNALRALAEYTKFYRADTRRYQTLLTEIAFSVPVAENRVVHGKMDTVVLDELHNTILSFEHKTTGRKTGSWYDQWEVIMQPIIYNHALHTLYHDVEGLSVKGVVINGAVLRKNDNEFIRVPITKSANQLAAGLWATNHWLDQIAWNFEMLLETDADDEVMGAFPCNGSSCSKFGCVFSSYCAHWGNPLSKGIDPQPGFTQQYWDPRREQDDAKNFVDLASDEKKVVNLAP